jgi:hypothetical protein
VKNKCIQCSIEFEATESLWLFCKKCDKERRRKLAIETTARIQRFENDPDFRTYKKELAELRRQTLAEIYNDTL